MSMLGATSRWEVRPLPLCFLSVAESAPYIFSLDTPPSYSTSPPLRLDRVVSWEPSPLVPTAVGPLLPRRLEHLPPSIAATRFMSVPNIILPPSGAPPLFAPPSSSLVHPSSARSSPVQQPLPQPLWSSGEHCAPSSSHVSSGSVTGSGFMGVEGGSF